MPIMKKDADREGVMAAVDGLHAALKGAGIRVKVGVGRGGSEGLCGRREACSPASIPHVIFLHKSGCSQVERTPCVRSGIIHTVWPSLSIPLQ